MYTSHNQGLCNGRQCAAVDTIKLSQGFFEFTVGPLKEHAVHICILLHTHTLKLTHYCISNSSVITLQWNAYKMQHTWVQYLVRTTWHCILSTGCNTCTYNYW